MEVDQSSELVLHSDTNRRCERNESLYSDTNRFVLHSDTNKFVLHSDTNKFVLHSDIKSLNKTYIYTKKASNSLGIVYKNNNPKSSPILYSNITISQDNTNQSTITEDQKTENNITQSNILDINNKHNTIQQSNEQINKINNEIQLISDRINVIQFNSFLNFSKYYNLRPQDISETSTCSSWFVSLKLYWENSNDKNNNINSKYCSEYILSDNLLKTISCINKLVNLILCDAKTLIDNKYIINYVNEYLVNFEYNNTNLPDPSTDLFQKYQFQKYDKNILHTDAMTYIFYRTFKALQYLLYSLDQQQTNFNSITEVIQNKEEVNNSKQELKEILKQSKEIINQKVNEGKKIEKKLSEYETYYNYNKYISDGIIQQINEYKKMENNTKEEKRINRINKEIEKCQNNLTQITNKLSHINSAKNKYRNKLKNIKTEINAIKKELDKKYKYYINEKNTCNCEFIMNKISKNLEKYYDNKEQLDSNLAYIYSNNKNLNPTKLNIIKNNEKQIIDNSIKHNESINETNQNISCVNSNTVSRQVLNELQIQKNNVKNYIELLKDIMKQLFNGNNKINE